MCMFTICVLLTWSRTRDAYAHVKCIYSMSSYECRSGIYLKQSDDRPRAKMDANVHACSW